MDASKADKTKDIEQEQEEEVKHFRITLTHKGHGALEATINSIAENAARLTENGAKIKYRGPARLPTKCLSITTRKSPCGNGTNTFDRFDLYIHKRVLHIECSQRNFQSILSQIKTEPGMIIEANDVDSE